MILFVFYSEGLGSFFGTIGGPIKDTDPTKPKYRERTKPPSEKANFKANPAKKGTGYGYKIPISYWIISYLSFSSYPNLGIDKDPSYTYKDINDKYDAPLDAQRVK